MEGVESPPIALPCLPLVLRADETAFVPRSLSLEAA